MDLGRAFSYVTDDERWLNTILLGGLIMLIPIVGQIALIGFMLEVARNVMQGNPRPLPDWSNFGDKLGKGLAGLLIQIVYGLPVALVGFVFACIAISGGLAAGNNEEAAAGIFSLLFLCFFPLLLLLGLILQPVLLAAMVRYVQTNRLGAAFEFGAVITTVRSALGTWVVLWLVYILCGIVGGLGSIAFGIGVLFTLVYSQAVFGHALGQIAASTGGATGQPPTNYGSPLYQ